MQAGQPSFHMTFKDFNGLEAYIRQEHIHLLVNAGLTAVFAKRPAGRKEVIATFTEGMRTACTESTAVDNLPRLSPMSRPSVVSPPRDSSERGMSPDACLQMKSNFSGTEAVSDLRLPRDDTSGTDAVSDSFLKLTNNGGMEDCIKLLRRMPAQDKALGELCKLMKNFMGHVDSFNLGPVLSFRFLPEPIDVTRTDGFVSTLVISNSGESAVLLHVCINAQQDLTLWEAQKQDPQPEEPGKKAVVLFVPAHSEQNVKVWLHTSNVKRFLRDEYHSRAFPTSSPRGTAGAEGGVTSGREALAKEPTVSAISRGGRIGTNYKTPPDGVPLPERDLYARLVKVALVASITIMRSPLWSEEDEDEDNDEDEHKHNDKDEHKHNDKDEHKDNDKDKEKDQQSKLSRHQEYLMIESMSDVKLTVDVKLPVKQSSFTIEHPEDPVTLPQSPYPGGAITLDVFWTLEVKKQQQSRVQDRKVNNDRTLDFFMETEEQGQMNKVKVKVNLFPNFYLAPYPVNESDGDGDPEEPNSIQSANKSANGTADWEQAPPKPKPAPPDCNLRGLCS